jgi:enamine deaminase RidA (YjgF/YER057c/UK114 family)
MKLSLARGIVLPAPPNPVGTYQRGVIVQGLGFLSGQFPIQNNQLRIIGRLGAEVSLEQGIEAAQIAAANVLAQIGRLLDDNALSFDRLIRVEGYVASANGFLDVPSVLDGASNFFLAALGEQGRHARSALSVSHLPMNAPLELVVSFAVKM